MSHLKTLRSASGLTQVQLSQAIGVDQSLVSRYESGERLPSHEIIDKIKVRVLDAVIENVTIIRREIPILEEMKLLR